MVQDLGEPLSEAEIFPPDLLAEQEAAFARDIERMHARAGEFVQVDCPACDLDATAYIFDKFGFTFQRCEGCRTIYMSPRPSEAVMNDYYSNSENYAIWAEHVFPKTEAARRDKIHKPWFQRITDHCEQYSVPMTTLVEVGPGFGTFASVATDSGRFDRVVAVEPTPELAQACRDRGVDVVEKRIEDVDRKDLPDADVIVAFEVIEHLFDPGSFLDGIRTRMREGGLLVMSCPNGEGFDISVLGADSMAVDAEHVNLFNPDSMATLLESHGLEPLQITTPGRLDAEFVRDAARDGKVDLDPFLQRVLIDEWDRLAWPFQEFLAANGLSSHMWTVARRPTG